MTRLQRFGDPRARKLAMTQLAEPGTLMVIAPHPDDETLGCGMALSRAAAMGHGVVLVLLTDGEGSHPSSSSYPPARLRRVRRGELALALRSLGVRAEVWRCGMADGKDALHRLSPALTRALTRRAHRAGVRTIWTTCARDAHCDHAKASRLGRRLARSLRVPCWEYAVWSHWTGDHAKRAGAYFHPRANRRKRAAMQAYRTQLTPLIDDDPDGFMMPREATRFFASQPEIFSRVG